jgi:adhesin transport system membrane fusion protein
MKIQHYKNKIKAYLSGHGDAKFIGEAGLSLDQARSMSQQIQLTRALVRISSISLTLLLVWSAFAKVPQAALGEARVVPSQRLQEIQAVDGGVISAVMVKEGQQVKTNDTLVQIDITRFSSNLKEKEAQETSLKLKEARLLAQLNKSSFKADNKLIQAFPELYSQEIKLLDSKLREWGAQAEIYEQQLNQRQRELDEAQSRASAARQNLVSSRQELESNRPLLKSGAVSQVEIMRLERDVSKAQGDYEAATAQSARLHSAISEARQKISETRLRQENEARIELGEVKAKLASLEQNQVTDEDRLSRATLKAPVDGWIQRILYSTKGAVVPAGQKVIEIVPIEEHLVFETRINPKDVAFIRPGQKATIRVTAYDYSIYGALTGSVDNVSADSISDENGRPFFAVKVSVPRDSVKQSIRLMPGMVANVSIETEERTVLSYLLKPILRGTAEMFTER